MKSYSVKSNAKRFARGLAGQFPCLVPAEPVAVADGAREWFPAVEVHLAFGELFEVPAELVATAVVVAEVYGGNRVEYGATIPIEEGTFLPLANHSGVEKPTITAYATEQEIRQGIVHVDVSIPVPPPLPASTMAKIAAKLPPLTPSSPEEIAARRAERRARIEEDKVSGTRVKTEKISKKKVILDLMKRDGGATQEELETATGWQRHTLRGYIAGTLRKVLAPIGYEIECVRGKGEAPTCYRITTRA